MQEDHFWPILGFFLKILILPVCFFLILTKYHCLCQISKKLMGGLQATLVWDKYEFKSMDL